MIIKTKSNFSLCAIEIYIFVTGQSGQLFLAIPTFKIKQMLPASLIVTSDTSYVQPQIYFQAGLLYKNFI